MNALHALWDKLMEEEAGRCKERAGLEIWRPRLHIAPPCGSLNDPNGVCQYGGV